MFPSKIIELIRQSAEKVAVGEIKPTADGSEVSFKFKDTDVIILRRVLLTAEDILCPTFRYSIRLEKPHANKKCGFDADSLEETKIIEYLFDTCVASTIDLDWIMGMIGEKKTS